jgi:hypothetical protein
VTEVLRDLLLPRTDAGVLVQALVVVVLTVVALVGVRREPALRLLVLGVATMIAAGFGLRALH